MAMQQCPNGHLYDDTKNSSCPYCNGGNNSAGKTMPVTSDMIVGNRVGNDIHEAVVGDFPPTAKLDINQFVDPQPEVAGERIQRAANNEIPRTEPLSPDESKTIYKQDIINDKGIVEVRGWLVCLEGSKKGVDFKVHGEKNTIGRGRDNDINLDFDNTISKGVNAIIAYDNKNNKFYIYQGNSKNNIYFNNQLLLTPLEIKDYDVIEIGETKMIFRSLCNDSFSWEAKR